MIYVDIHQRRFVIEIVPQDYGSQEVPRPAMCKVEAKGR